LYKSSSYCSPAFLPPANTILTSNSTGTKFLITEEVDFTQTSSAEINFVDSNYFLFKKSVPAISAEVKSTSISFQGNQKFATTNITDTNILQILNVTESNGNIWYEVTYLAQTSIYKKISNPTSATDQVPYLLQLQRVPRRFVSRILSDNTLQLEFGAGLSQNKTDSQIIPTPDNINLGLVPGISLLTNNFNEASVMFTQEYGLVPSGSFIVKYLDYILGESVSYSSINSNEINCNICYENLKSPVIEIHCQNLFCGECLLTWLKYQNTCPLCRTEIINKDLIYIQTKNDDIKSNTKQNIKNDENTTTNMTKAEKIVDIIKNNKKGKFLIFSDHDGSFTTIKTMLNENNINCEQIRGNSKNIEKRLSSFKNDENNVIFLNSRHNGAGINLQEATDIILYHNMADGIKQQLIGRANRIGRINTLNVHLLQI
jgi:hypothetical protein